VLGALLLSASGLAAAQTAPPSTEPGAWQLHELEFQFLGFTTTYSCDGLESKLRLLLGRLGARPGYSVQTYGCARGSGMPDRFARARVSFASLQPSAGAAVPATGAPAAAGQSAEAPVAGAWKSIALAPHRPLELDGGDCELIEQFRDRLLPLFTTRAVQNQLHCVPHQASGGYSLSFEVFAPTGKA